MCTMALLHRVHPEFPLVVAANRDERFARPWTPPTALSESPRIIGGRDDEKGGTWMGVTASGLFAGITNQPVAVMTAAPRSRGEIVLHALAAGTMAAASDVLAALDPRAYNPWNLAFGDGDTLRIAYGRRDADHVALRDVPPGLHILANDVLEGKHPRIARARELFTPLVSLPWSAFAAAAAVALADPVLCLRSPLYGTCSATILAIEPGHVVHYRFAAGPPDQTEFRDVGLI